MNDLLENLAWRGLIHQMTDDDAVRKHLAAPRKIYAGFDPTADSLTIGNLIPITLLTHFQRAGHTPVIVMGGGTGLIGDPSGKSDERQLLTREHVQSNVDSQRGIFEGLLSFNGENAATILDNADWLCELSYLDALRGVGKHFSVNMMIQKDSVRDRLHAREQGISYTEFSYMILQAYDFAHLYKENGVTMQVGGSDQWGNIVAGVDLVRRIEHKEAFGLTAPLVTKSDGGKFGKTEKGAIWLTKERTSPYAFHQFWLNTLDADIEKFLKFFTLFPHEHIEALLKEHNQDPGARTAHHALAQHMTERLHGADAAAQAEHAGKALFTGNVGELDLSTLEEVFAEAPSSEHAKSQLQEGVPLVDLLPDTTLAKSKREAREFLTNGSISVNGQRVEANALLTESDLLHGAVALLRRGKKTWHATRWR